MQRIIFRLLMVMLVLALLFQFASCRKSGQDKFSQLALYPENIKGMPGVRILIKDKLKQVMLSVSGKYELYSVPADDKAKLLGQGRGPVVVKVVPTVAGINLGETKAAYSRIGIRVRQGSRMLVDGVDYGDDFIFSRFMADSSGEKQQPLMRVIAKIPMEQYLVGVVPAEMPSYWPAEALRAQCVAARSYALYKMSTRNKFDYDLKRTAASQVWKPTRKGNPVINAVVNSTSGLVITDNYRLFPAYFSAQCGGATKDGVEVFISRHITPLTGVTCSFCSGKPGARRWQYTISFVRLGHLLKQAGYKIGSIIQVKALDNKRRVQQISGRVYDVSIEHQGQGRILVLSAMKFRSILGTRNVLSTFFLLSCRKGKVGIKGRGNGHGVGLCQNGAMLMAKRGGDYRQILDHYYSANTLVKLW